MALEEIAATAKPDTILGWYKGRLLLSEGEKATLAERSDLSGSGSRPPDIRFVTEVLDSLFR